MAREVVVLGGSSGEHIAISLAGQLEADLGEVEVKTFPDGETYVRVATEVEGKSVVYVNSLQRGVNEKLVETLITLDALRDLGARRVYAVIPYMSYARQDSRFNPGEAVSIFTLGRLMNSVAPDHIITVDMHLHRIGDPRRVFGEKFTNVTAVPLLAEYVKSAGFPDQGETIVVGPDEEAEQWARVMAEALGLEYTVLEKRRLSADEVVVEARDARVESRNVIIVDDIISTGGTIVEAVEALRRLGAREIAVTCVHPILTGRAYPRLKRLGLRHLACTDTVLSPISLVESSPAIARALEQLL